VSSSPTSTIELSVVIPIRDEAASLPELYREFTERLTAWGRPYELILVDDGSTDGSFDVMARIQGTDPRVRVLRLRRNFGQTAAFAAGFDYARGRLVATSDGDLQNDPGDLPAMVEMLDRGHDIVCGWRKDRKDAFFLAAAAIDDGQQPDFDRDRRSPARLRLLAESLSRRDCEGHAPLRRDASVPPGDCQRADQRHRRNPGESPAP
jgi:glycosyltransferase involved in cell wall biosynthesis